MLAINLGNIDKKTLRDVKNQIRSKFNETKVQAKSLLGGNSLSFIESFDHIFFMLRVISPQG